MPNHTISTSKATYLIRGNWTREQLLAQFDSFKTKYQSNISFDQWLRERGKVYVRLQHHT